MQGLMALTKIVQRYIYEKQHPSDCGSQRYLILNKFPGDDAFGLGAIIQRISDYLSVAIQTDAILLYANDESPGEHFLSENRASCGRSLDCIFQELSNCSSQAQKGMNSNTQSTFSDRQFDLDVEAFLAKHKYPIPFVFEEALKKIQPDVTREMLKYWWRAQAAAYIMRFNRNTSRRLKQFRLGEDTKQLGLHWDVNGDPRNVNVPFPLPEGTISMHVRHGDKGSEMRLVPFNDYVVRAEKFSAENPLGNWKRAFLSTEDPNVIEQMKTMARITPFSYSGSNSRWTWYWTDIPRLNTGPETQLKEFGNRTDLTIKWLLQLVMAIECDVFVGTRGSGWNRLIDSLRCIWLASCKQPFLEVGFEEDWMGYGP
ncbi:mitochondrial inner membrane protein required for protein import [Orbilia oligospora]|nr:mitochondrial inner membrane protein required for protein import [Orbilia oligospora]